jgi:hypothetical protein
LAQGASSAIREIGFLPPVVGLASVALATFNSSMRVSVQEKASASTAATGLAGAYNRLAASATLVGTATRTFTVIMRSIPHIAIFMGLAWGIEKVVSHFVGLRREQEEIEKRNRELTNSWIEQRDRIDELLPKFNELTKIRDSDGLNVQLEQEYLDVQNQLADILPSLVKSIDEKGNAHLITGKALEREIELLKEREALRRDERIENSQTAFGDTIKRINDLNEQILSKEKRLESMEDFNRIIEETGKQVEGKTSAEFRQVRNEILDLMGQINNEGYALLDNFISDINDRLWFENIRLNTEATNALLEYAEAIDLSKMSVAEYDGMLRDLTGAFVLFKEGIDTKALDEYSQQTGIAQESLLKLRKSFESIARRPVRYRPR